MTAEVGVQALGFKPFDISAGGQIGVVPGTSYHADHGGPVVPARPHPHGAARLGVGLEVGVDTSRWTRVPMRFFVHYRQLALAPFMLGNDLPAMGAATLTAGASFRLGRHR